MPLDVQLPREEERRRAALIRFGEEYTQRQQECTRESLAKFVHELHTKIRELLESTSAADQLSGLERILELTPRDSEDGASKITNFANFLRQPLASSDTAVAALASRCLGQLARAEGGHAAVKPALDHALKRLKEGNRLDSAVLVLHELAEQAPTLIYGDAVDAPYPHATLADVSVHAPGLLQPSRRPPAFAGSALACGSPFERGR